MLFCIPIYDDLRKTCLGEKTGKLVSIEDPHPINDRKPLAGVGIFSVRLIDDQKDAARPQSSVHLPEALRRTRPEIYRFKCGHQIKCTILEGKARHISLYDTAAAGLQPLAVNTLGLFHRYF